VIGRFLIVIGGIDERGHHKNDIWIYDFSNSYFDNL
jgi:hypothetical protein